VRAGTALWAPQSRPQWLAYLSPADELFYGGAAGGGKALMIETPLPTPTGWTTMADVEAGDCLLDENGQPCIVLAATGIMLGHPCYRITFSDGASLVADEGHQWHTMTDSERSKAHRRTPEYRANRRANRPSRSAGRRPDLVMANKERDYALLDPPMGKVRTTQDIYHTLKVRGRTNHSIGVCQSLELPEADLPIDPYIFGAWLGDGSSYKAEITTADPEIIDSIEEEYETKRRSEIAYGIYGLLTTLKELGLIGQKRILPIYLRGSTGQRLALLQGLMDTDGYCDPRGQCEFTTTSPALRDGMFELLGTLGIKVAISEGRATLNGRDCGPKYRLKFLTSLPAFRLKRKLEGQKGKGFRGTHEQRYIVGVEPIESVPVRCIKVSSLSGIFLAGTSFIPTHNSDLLEGLAITAHEKSIIFRREYTQLTGATGLIERSHELLDDHAHYNAQEHVWRDIPDGRSLDFGAVQHEKDKRRYQGRPHDLIAFDEVTEFTESQYRFLIGWLRTTTEGQRCRVVATGNPPTHAEGEWVIRYWAPWLDDTHPSPAQPGELRWFAVIKGKSLEVDGPEPFEQDGETVIPQSRTFIPARLSDNVYLMRTGYEQTLQGLPEPLRSQLLYGDFTVGTQDDPWQTIPTAWVRAAFDRWEQRERPDTPLTMLGVDVARGGDDQTVLSRRYDNWFAPLEKHDGRATPDGPSAAALAIMALGDDDAQINIDVIGVGASAYDDLANQSIRVTGVNFAEKSDARDRSGRLAMRNKRAEAYWGMREALDPIKGDDIALPRDNELLADLCAPRWKITTGGILIESKEDIKARLGHSPDCGDAVVLARMEGRKILIGWV